MRTTKDLTVTEVYRYEATGELPDDVSDDQDSLTDDDTIDPAKGEEIDSAAPRRGRNYRGVSE